MEFNVPRKNRNVFDYFDSQQKKELVSNIVLLNHQPNNIADLANYAGFDYRIGSIWAPFLITTPPN